MIPKALDHWSDWVSEGENAELVAFVVRRHMNFACRTSSQKISYDDDDDKTMMPMAYSEGRTASTNTSP